MAGIFALNIFRMSTSFYSHIVIFKEVKISLISEEVLI